MFHPSIRPVVNTLLHTIPLDLHSEYAQTLLKTLQDIATLSYPNDDQITDPDDPVLDALLAEQPCTSERLDSVLQCFLNIDCIALHFTVLRFLLYQLQHKTYHINFALCFIRQHCCSLLQQPPFQPIRDGIFAQALSLWNAEALWDLVTYRSLVALLHDLSVPSNVWLSTLATSPMMDHQRL
ncbi:hypothetical protein LRAMOSA04973 [Lichtheimia ramosa]|uniref:Uncharacterized protein n=1 Tax=Lichtheimia ramosa TaxID=688394 RepID=A0A077WZX5_9FUNG|nr:hypothetical protein LRAMOSA04973 [Lichtheimia ramosa]